jgi:DNA-binding transcriptional regulator YhcF (GntR family)
MNIITETYQELKSNDMVVDKRDFSINWAKRNHNWLTYTEHKKRDACLEVIINIYTTTQEQISKYQNKRRKIGWLADDMIQVLKRINDRIMKYILQKYGIKYIETTAA